MNQTSKDTTRVPGQNVFQRRIGSTTYRVGIHFNPDAKENFNDKILRLMKNDLNLLRGHATMELPQTGWLPGGSPL